MNREIFLSILAMDSYNRGYGQGLTGLPVQISRTKIGDATIVRQSDISPNSDGVTAGFYAIAYNWNGERIISFRGTDFTTGWSKVLDVFNGWSSFTGIGTNSQFAFAHEFYKSVAGRDFPNANGVYVASGITVTGHSRMQFRNWRAASA